MKSGTLTGNRDAIVMDGGNTLIRVAVPGLAIQSEMTIGPHRGIMCLDDEYVRPATGLAYFSCSYGSDTSRVLAVDTLKKTVVADLDPSTFPEVRDNPVVKPLAKVFESEDRRVQDWSARRDLKYTFLLPNGNLVLGIYDSGSSRTAPRLLLCEAETGNILSTWTETETYTDTDTRRAPAAGEAPRQDPHPLGLAHATLSKDGSRLFAVSKAGADFSRGVLFYTATLEPLRRWTLPEEAGGADECFVPAPDGHGMWLFGQSGRLDDHTGELIEEVKLPFHLVSLIRER
jgi:hypothetical protein